MTRPSPFKPALDRAVDHALINQGLVRFLGPRLGARAVDHDARTDEVIARIVKSGETFFGGTTWRGARRMRVSVCNWQTSDADIERAVAAVRGALAAPLC